MVKLPPSSPHSSDQAKEKESAYFRWEVWQWRRVALNAVWTVLMGGLKGPPRRENGNVALRSRSTSKREGPASPLGAFLVGRGLCNRGLVGEKDILGRRKRVLAD